MSYAYKLNTALQHDIANQNEVVLSPTLFRPASSTTVQLSAQGRLWVEMIVISLDVTLLCATFLATILITNTSVAILPNLALGLAAYAIGLTSQSLHKPHNLALLRLATFTQFAVMSFSLLGAAYFTPLLPLAFASSWLLMLLPLMLAMRAVLRYSLPRFTIFDGLIERILFIGQRDDLQQFVHMTTRHPFLPFRFMGYFVLNKAEATPEDEAYLGSMDDEDYILLNGDVDRIILIARQADTASLEQTLAKIDGLNARVDLCLLPLANLEQEVKPRSLATLFQNCHLVTLRQADFQGAHALVKRLFDITASAAALVALSPILIAIAVAVTSTSKGGIFFRQQRWGLNGKPFFIYKFRSMYVHDDGAIIRQATLNDSRITKVGAFLRSTSLDELPQLLNILKGDMSVIGPRPHAVSHNRFYTPQVQGYLKRYRAKPGLSGLAQINGYRGETPTLDLMQKRIDFDVAYIRSWSFWLDIVIIVRTFGLVLSRRNAY